MSLKKNVSRISAFQPGLIEDLPDQENKGYTTFKNVLLSVAGLLGKRKGWRINTDDFSLNSYTNVSPRSFGNYSGIFSPIDSHLFQFNYERLNPVTRSDITPSLDVFYPIYGASTPWKFQNLQRDINLENSVTPLQESTPITPAVITGTTPQYVFNPTSVIGGNKVQLINTPDNLFIVNPGDVVRRSPMGYYRNNQLLVWDGAVGPTARLTKVTNAVAKGYFNASEAASAPYVTDNKYAKTLDLHGPILTTELNTTNTQAVHVGAIVGPGVPSNLQVVAECADWYGNNKLETWPDYVNNATPEDTARLFKKKIQPGWYYYIIVPIYNDGTRGMVDIGVCKGDPKNPASYKRCTFASYEAWVYVNNDNPGAQAVTNTIINTVWPPDYNQTLTSMNSVVYDGSGKNGSTFFNKLDTAGTPVNYTDAQGNVQTINFPIWGRYTYHLPPVMGLRVGNGPACFDIFDESVIGFAIYRTQRQNQQAKLKSGDDFSAVFSAPNNLSWVNTGLDYFWVKDFYKDTDMVLISDAAINGGINPLADYYFFDAQKNALWQDDTPDTSLGDKYVYPGILNEVTTDDGYYKENTSSQWVGKDNSIHSSCGLFSDNRMFLNDDRNPGLLLISQTGHQLAFPAELAMQMPSMDLSNPITGMAKAGLNTFIFGENSIVMMRPTGSAITPYMPTIISTHVGLKANVSLTVLDNLIYFIGNDGRFWICDTFGSLKEVGGAINNSLLDATDSIILKSNPFDISVRLMFRGPLTTNSLNTVVLAANKDYEYRCLVWYPRRQFLTEELGYRDSFVDSGDVDGNGTPILQLKAKADEYVIQNYWYVHGLEQEFGLTKFGEMAYRTSKSDYQDRSSATLKQDWTPFATYPATSDPLTNNYPVPIELERPLYFDNKTKLNSIILYGEGKWLFSFSVDGGAYSKPKYYTLNKQGVEISIGFIGRLFKLKFANEDNVDISLTEIALVTTNEGGVNAMNVVDAGTAAGDK